MVRLNNNIEIPQIGVGTWTLRGETARQNVRLALEAGFRHIDTAQGYDHGSMPQPAYKILKDHIKRLTSAKDMRQLTKKTK